MPEAALDFAGEPPAAQAARIAALNDRYRHHGATAVLQGALRDPQAGRLALVSSFGAESVVLLHLVAMVDRRTPVLFIDTQMLFAETLVYQQELAERLALENLRIITADDAAIAARDPQATLHLRDTDACCDLRKTLPLQQALAGYDGWITGRKRYQGSTRQALEFFEADGPDRIKVNPLAHWTRDDITAYMDENRLPRHPLVAKGYPSIGCAPCTSPVAPGEDPRAGRWRGQDKNECGIHIVDGKVVRRSEPMTDPETRKDGGVPAPTEVAPGTPAPAEGAAPVIVTDTGFAADGWTGPVLDLPPDTDPDAVDLSAAAGLIRVDFPSFADGRGFTIAKRLRMRGYQGRLRARGHVIADQYAMARRAGFDEVEIDAQLAARQPQTQWVFRADWRAHDYQSRLRAR